MKEQMKQFLQHIQTLIYSVIVVICFGGYSLADECSYGDLRLADSSANIDVTAPEDYISYLRNENDPVVNYSSATSVSPKAGKMEEYIIDRTWSVEYETGTLTGYAACGGNKYNKGQTYTYPWSSAFGGCLCSLDKQSWYFTEKVSTTTGWEPQITECYEKCPRVCAQYAASTDNYGNTEAPFVATLIGSVIEESGCPIEERNIKVCAANAHDNGVGTCVCDDNYYATGYNGSDVSGCQLDIVCNANQMKYIDPDTNGRKCVAAKFTLNIDTSLGNGQPIFEFKISAAGVFYVDWGDGVVQQIDRTNNLTQETITHTYSGTYAGLVRFGGEADGYSSYNDIAAIDFQVGFNYNERKLTAMSGSLGAIFGTKDNPIIGIGQPRFSKTFMGASNMMGTIPDELFYGIHGAPIDGMFASTFSGCSSLEGSIPETLFCQDVEHPNETNCIYGAPAQEMFRGTFANCSGLSGYIPPKLFVGILKGTDIGDQMFNMLYRSGLYESCDADYYQFETGFESYFNNKVSCEHCPENTHSLAGATRPEQCCPEHYHWSAGDNTCMPEPVNIIFDYTNGGVGCNNISVGYGVTTELTCVPRYTGFNFLGWYDAVDGGRKIESVTPYEFEDIVLYAHWEVKCLSNEYYNGEDCVCKPGYTLQDMPWINNYKIDADDYEPYQTLHPETYYEMRDAMNWRVEWWDTAENREMAGIELFGDAACSSDESAAAINGSAASGSDVREELTDQGQYCWCRMTNPVMSKWVYVANVSSGNYDDCLKRCPGYCGSYVSGVTVQSNVRKAIYNNLLTDENKICLPDEEQPQNNNQCETGPWLHIGDEKMCLLEEVQQRPALAVRVGTKTYYLNMSDSDLPINSTSNKKMHVLYGGDIYNIHDNSVE